MAAKIANTTNELFSFNSGDVLFVLHMTPNNIENFAICEETYSLSKKITFHTKCVALLEGVTDNLKTAKHMRTIREFSENVDIRGFKIWSRMRKILQKNKVQTIPVLGGFQNVLTVPDEVAIADFAVTGSSGWVVKNNLISALIRKNPLPPERIQQLQEELEKLEKKYNNLFSNNHLKEMAGKILWDGWREVGVNMLALQEGEEWVRITNGDKTYGFNSMEEVGANEEGLLRYECQARRRTVYYKPIPENSADVIFNDKSRWLVFFESYPDSEFVPILLAEEVSVEYLKGLEIIAQRVISKELILKKINSDNETIILEKKIATIKKTLSREKQ